MKEFPADQPPREPPSIEASDDEACRIIREAMAANDGFISQREGAEIVLRQLPSFKKTRAMELVKDMTLDDLAELCATHGVKVALDL